MGSARPRREVGVRLLTGDSLDPPLDPHLAAERIPVEEKRRARIRVELGCLTADVSREEDEAVFVGALQQHHPHRGRAVRPSGGQRHRLRRFDPGLTGLGVPAPELLQWVRIDGRFAQLFQGGQPI